MHKVLGSERDHYLVIDADEFKQLLLHEAQRDGTYETLIKPDEIRNREAHGEQFFPLELSSLVHEESSLLAKAQRERAIEQGKNIVVDTVLSSEHSAQRLGQQLTEAG